MALFDEIFNEIKTKVIGLATDEVKDYKEIIELSFLLPHVKKLGEYRLGKLNDFFIEEAKEQVSIAFDEILKLEDKKLRK